MGANKTTPAKNISKTPLKGHIDECLKSSAQKGSTEGTLSSKTSVHETI